ncbi:MAG TPA: ABC transporter permease DevC [Candidatus Sulfopaludibacter sp.]|jgi:putative ABC transport system permease protein|nr:ABC transporter permease DevC [Candidatus Sulfopaludibacter sp.]
MFTRVPIAWLQLTHEKLRLFAAVSGIAFAVVLMLMQLGFREALSQASSLVQDRLQCDLVLTSRQYDYLVFSKFFTRRRLYQSLSYEGVQAVAGVYLGLAQWKNPEDLHERAILVIGYDPASSAIAVPGDQDLHRLDMPDTVFFDAGSRSEFGPVVDQYLSTGSVKTEVNGRKIQVVGLFRMGTSFGVNGTLLANELNFLRMFPGHPQDLVEIGLIRLKPGADPESVRAGLEKGLPPDVHVMTREGFIRQERDYWAWHTGIGYIFTLGLAMGFVVGGVIVYQILYTDVSNHLKEYATLKALGYRDSYLSSIVLRQAILLSLFGFVPGFAIAKFLYGLTAKATLLPMILPLERAAGVLALTVGMCAIAALLAVRKLRRADPAEIF